uniref:Uncharacterized protein n=1 Tax=Setaria viridis TaxID=4556 RepID=A0A4U6T9I5_SETVI|nr:hypothetical protein SEVIR_9G569850v2 [Setaria viridis]
MVQDSKLSDSRERRPEIRSPTYGKLKNQQEHTHPVRWHGVRGICRPARVAALLVLCTCAVGAGRKRRRRDGGGGDASDGLSQGNATNYTFALIHCASTGLPLPAS